MNDYDKMENAKRVNRLHRIAKTLFLTQGLLLLAVGIKDELSYRCPEEAGVECARVINITWILVGFAVVHCISGFFAFFYSCTTTIYQPVICFILWSMCVCSLVIYRVKKLCDLEKHLSTNLAISLAIVTTYALVMLAEIIIHVRLICLQKGKRSGGQGRYQLLTLPPGYRI